MVGALEFFSCLLHLIDYVDMSPSDLHEHEFNDLI